ncbi:MAG: hypothetical protein AAB590_02025 [Patescibacteria group bacterium]
MHFLELSIQFVTTTAGFVMAAVFFSGFWSENGYLAVNVFLGLYSRKKAARTFVAVFLAAVITLTTVVTAGMIPGALRMVVPPYLGGLTLFLVLGLPLYLWYTSLVKPKKLKSIKGKAHIGHGSGVALHGLGPAKN